jgi:uncharacterized protein with PIN domain
MIVTDSSVFIAILEQEHEAERFLSIIRDAPRTLASAVTVYEQALSSALGAGGKALKNSWPS